MTRMERMNTNIQSLISIREPSSDSCHSWPCGLIMKETSVARLATGMKRADLCYTSAQNHWHRSKTDMATTLRWTSADLENLPHNSNRYEIIDGELIVPKQPHFN